MQPALVEAATAGDLQQVRALLEAGEAVDVRGNQGNTPLALAALHGHAEVVGLLLQHGAAPDARSETGHNPLVFAGSFDQWPVVDLLVAAGATVGPLEAAVLGDAATLERLLAAGSDVDTRNEQETTPLIEAAHCGRLAAATLLLDRGASIDAQTRFGWTPLMKAIFRGHGDVARLLLERGADVTLRHSIGGTALHCAVMSFKVAARPQHYTDILEELRAIDAELLDLIRLLVHHGADVNARNDGGGTALQWATSMHDRETCALLQSLGAV